MKQNRLFFTKINSSIKTVRNIKTLDLLEKRAKKYVNYLPESTNPRIKRDAKKRLRKTLKMINSKRKELK